MLHTLTCRRPHPHTPTHLVIAVHDLDLYRLRKGQQLRSIIPLLFTGVVQTGMVVANCSLYVREREHGWRERWAMAGVGAGDGECELGGDSR